MQKHLCFILALAISFVMLGATPAANSDIAGEYIPWDKRDLGDKFGNLSWNSTYYILDYPQTRKVVPASVGKLLGSVTLETHPTEVAAEKKKNPKLTDKDFIQKCNLYKVKWISSKYIIAVEYVGYDGYYLFSNGSYVSDNLSSLEKTRTFADLMRVTGFEHNIIFGEKADFTQSKKYFDKYDAAAATTKRFIQNPRTYSINGDKILLNKFSALSNVKIKDAIGPNLNIDPNAKIIMILEFKQKYIAGPDGMGAIYLYDDGTMRTKFDLIGEHYGNIGENKVHEIIDYIINNCTLIPNEIIDK